MSETSVVDERTRPRVVAIGGGHGLATTLRACRGWAELTAIVSVADDGGSSGRLRAELGLPAPGDIRRCLSALADERHGALARALEHRFAEGELEGHSAGNLLLAALAAELGDLAAAVDELATTLGVDATVLPATTEPVDLVAVLTDGTEVRGQSALEEVTGIDRVRIDPTDAPVDKRAVAALAAAELVVIGPGSLYGSVLAAAAVPAIAEAIASTTAVVAFVCNLRATLPETRGYDVAAHVAALRRHGMEPGVVLHHPGALPVGDLAGVELIEANIARPHGLAHDPTSLGAALRAVLAGDTTEPGAATGAIRQ